MQFKITLVSLFAALAIASPLEKRCTANGGSCTQLSQCCSGNCEYDSSIGLVCKAAAREEDVIPDGASSGSGPVQLEKRCSANGGKFSMLLDREMMLMLLDCSPM
ncbi:uncharacterized protein IWZ02DRAFT_455244 [Phyllosticta citriasiana]|uniref:uncharacterized protein n=1 Tax=Phyllosticta citriasiana TaxID=595635 RepID=UPI0030FD7800